MQPQQFRYQVDDRSREQHAYFHTERRRERYGRQASARRAGVGPHPGSQQMLEALATRNEVSPSSRTSGVAPLKIHRRKGQTPTGRESAPQRESTYTSGLDAHASHIDQPSDQRYKTCRTRQSVSATPTDIPLAVALTYGDTARTLKLTSEAHSVQN